MRMSEHELSRRRLVAEARATIAEVMESITQKYGELTEAEWLSVLHQIMGRIIGDAVVSERRGDEP